MGQGLSVIVCTLNEADRIERMIRHVGFADEILVVDCGSTDGTIERARAAGARVEHQDWLGFSKQKNRAAELAANDWVLSLDADEIVDEELGAAIVAALASGPDPRDAFLVDRRGDFLGEVLPNPQRAANRAANVRLYHRAHSRWDEEMEIHEMVRVEGTVRPLAGRLLHWNDLTIDQFVSMFSRYATTEAVEMYAAGKRTNGVEVLLRPVARVGWLLIFRGAWRLRGRGLIYAGMRGLGDFVRFAKLWEMQQRGGPVEGEGDRPAWGRDA
ncbi:MAG: glycosyltransferase family 2 protein [Solirubrobacteraceae bacterium]|nr:glycosyltransferase family 2 protein [Solirubrobacteraceae bacterium]